MQKIELKTIPGPKGKPIIGTGLEFRSDPLEYPRKLHQEYGEIVKTKLGTYKAIFLFNPDHIKYVLATNHANYHKGEDYKFLKEVLGDGLVTSEDDIWRRHRQIIQPIFHTDQLIEFIPQFNTLTDQFIATWIQKGEINNFNEMSALTASIVTKTILGADIELNVQEISEAVSFLTLHIQDRMESLLPIPYFIPTPENRKYKHEMSIINRIVDDIIQKHKTNKKNSSDILSKLLLVNTNSSEILTDKEIQDEIRTFFIAGHETTATALTWTHYVLAKYPEVRIKVINEIQAILGKENDPTYEDIKKMTYLDQVINEVMRLYPPIYTFGREPLKNDIIDDYSIPAGSLIIISQYVTHRDPLIWENPDEFNPDRFEEENIKKIHKYAYFPFGGGPRTCIGKHFALLEMKILLIKIYQKCYFELKSSENINPFPHFTLRPEKDIILKIKNLN